MAVEDLEPLTKREQKNGREGEVEGKDTGDSLNALLTSALHKHAAKKLAKVRLGQAILATLYLPRTVYLKDLFISLEIFVIFIY